MNNSNVVYAALKLIECLYKNGKLPEHVYRNILKEYSKLLVESRN